GTAGEPPARQPRAHPLVVGHRRLLDHAPRLRARRPAGSAGDRLHRAPGLHRLGSRRPGDGRGPGRAARLPARRHRRRGLLRRARRGARPVPRAAHPVRRRDRRAAPVRGQRGRLPARRSRRPGPGLAALAVPGRPALRRRPPAVAGRGRHHAPLPGRTRGHDREQRRLPGPRPRGFPPALLARGHAALHREDLRGGVPGGVPGAVLHRPGPRDQHQQPAGVGRPDPLVPRGGRGGRQLRQRRPPARRGRPAVRPRRRHRGGGRIPAGPRPLRLLAPL
ncbi:MAG: Histidinol-phosphatase, partial [uncultured Blastococcus sp.]